ncbi:MAG: glycolate oxidase subunit GlcF [Betaproteobacteria bacterium]|jgi:glycolate oxidase iron-sulfur subunit|nr:glycolate oxidase subunit GlcF [Betaproteobacteria bacterium]
MQTKLADFIRDTPQGREAEAILRKCVHCGFCTATCPTYQLLGDELDGPRGRIYLMKQVLEGEPATAKTQLHLDRCLTCRACETTCPSGVHYSRLLDIGRAVVAEQVPRTGLDKVRRQALAAVLPRPALFNPLLAAGRIARTVLPRVLDDIVPEQPARPRPWPLGGHTRRMLVLDGCVQPALSPATNAAAARVLDKLGITLERAPTAGCCGAVTFHLDQHEQALTAMRNNIDAWWPHVEQGAEALIFTASGCGVMITDYGHLLAHDPAYAERAKRISAMACDLSIAIEKQKNELKQQLKDIRPSGKFVFHPPCTLQHGLKLKGRVEALLTDLGFDLAPVTDAHLCCGSAGTYAILQPEISGQLKQNKIKALTAQSPAQILTANIGCQSHLQSATQLPVRHWIEAVDDLLSG